MNRSPNIAFFGGTLIIAVMVMAAFANLANAGSCSRDKSSQAAQEQVEETKSANMES